jgi:uncharacterized protein (TIGR02246 family)
VSQSDHALMQMLDRYKAAVFAKDVDAFVALYADDVRVFDTWGKWSYDGIAAWGAMVNGWFGSLGDERVLVDFTDVRTRVDADLATLHAFAGFKAVSSEGKVLHAMQNRMTWTLKRAGDSWQVVHEHTSTPIDFENMKAILKR